MVTDFVVGLSRKLGAGRFELVAVADKTKAELKLEVYFNKINGYVLFHLEWLFRDNLPGKEASDSQKLLVSRRSYLKLAQIQNR